MVLDSAVTGTTHIFKSTDDLRIEIINARVYGGMHYRNSVEVGATIGEQVADWVDAHHFRCIQEEDDDDDNSRDRYAGRRPRHDDCARSSARRSFK